MKISKSTPFTLHHPKLRYQLLSDSNGNASYGPVLVAVVNFNYRPVRQSLADLPPFHTTKTGVADRKAEVVTVSSGCRSYAVKERVYLGGEAEVRLKGNEGVVIFFPLPRY